MWDDKCRWFFIIFVLIQHMKEHANILIAKPRIWCGVKVLNYRFGLRLIKLEKRGTISKKFRTLFHFSGKLQQQNHNITKKKQTCEPFGATWPFFILDNHLAPALERGLCLPCCKCIICIKLGRFFFAIRAYEKINFCRCFRQG